jgi:glycine/D-amino acid oxidase-like deaminating enzyme
MKILIIGGGFFGMYLSEYLAKSGCEVTLIEKQDDFMQGASYVNQARVHNGYHYPRSILTASRSRLSFSSFIDEFKTCIDRSFSQNYMISKMNSKISPKQFEIFCKRIGAKYRPATNSVTKLIDLNYVQAAYNVEEYAFNSIELKKEMKSRLIKANVSFHLGVEVKSIHKDSKTLVADIQSNQDKTLPSMNSIEVDQIFNCTYSSVNEINRESGLDIISLRHELAEITLVDVPEELKNTGVTIVDGPFFSIMPFPSTNFHSLSHVRYTPHFDWHDNSLSKSLYLDIEYYKKNEKSAYRKMIQDAQRYIPILSRCKYRESLWETKTILPSSEVNDSRPILFKENNGINGYHCIIGGKIDNIYDVISIVKKMRLTSGK